MTNGQLRLSITAPRSVDGSDTTRRSVLGFFLAVGAACLTAATVGGRLAPGLVTFGSLAVCSVVRVMLGRRRETYQGVTAKAPDERFAGTRGWAWAGMGILHTVGNLSAFTSELALPASVL